MKTRTWAIIISMLCGLIAGLLFPRILIIEKSIWKESEECRQKGGWIFYSNVEDILECEMTTKIPISK